MDQFEPVMAAEPEAEQIAGPERLVLAPTMAVEQADPSSRTIYLSSTGVRLRVPLALYDLLLCFEDARDMADVTAGNPRAAAALARLRDKGFLVRESEARRPAPPRLTTDPVVRLFDCPAWKAGQAATDIVSVGVPYDLSEFDAVGARRGPAALRETSLQFLYGVDRRTGRPRGWFDADLRRPVLADIGIADAGDVFVDPGEPQGRLFERIGEMVGRIVAAGSLPVLIGGDSSIAVPAVARLQEVAPLAVVRIGGAGGDGRAESGSYVAPATQSRRLLDLAGVERLVHLSPASRPPDLPGLITLSADSIRTSGSEPVAAALAGLTRCYMSLDLRVLGASGSDPAEGERLGYCELVRLLRSVGAVSSIVGLDIVGASPLAPGWGARAVTAVHLLLTGLSAAKDPQA